MSLKVNNTKPSGTNAIPCDAGTPISGRTANNGTYEILKLNADGSLPVSGTVTPLPGTAAYIGVNAQTISLGGGTPGANIYLGQISVISLTSIDAGFYSVNPVFIFANGGTNAGGTTFLLYKDGTAIDSYINTLVGGNSFNPGMIDLLTGVFGYWHNTTNQFLGATTSISYNRNNVLNTYLEQGIYKIAVITDGNPNFAGGPGYVGLYDFTKL